MRSVHRALSRKKGFELKFLIRLEHHNWKLGLCRVFLHSAKSFLHLATYLSAKGLYRVLFIGALGKIFCAVTPPSVDGHFAEWPPSTRQFFLLCRVPQARHSTKFFFSFFCKNALPSASAPALGKVFLSFFKHYFAECYSFGTRQSFFSFFLKNTLPSATGTTLGKVCSFFKKTLLC
jgi:hypothetical protein